MADSRQSGDAGVPGALVRVAGRLSPWRRVRAAARRWPLTWFFITAYAGSWAYWIPLALSDRAVRTGSGDPTHFPGLLGPLLAALLVTWLVGGAPGLRDLFRAMGRWRVSPRWYAVAASPLMMFAVAAAGLALAGRPLPRPGGLAHVSGLPVLPVLLVWLVLLLVNGYGEETGWRGFALPHLQQRMSSLRASLLLAVLWAGWHLPLFFLLASYQGFSLVLLPGFFLGLACGSVLLTWIYNRSNSVAVVAAWHATYNLVVASAAGDGIVAAVVTTVVMAWAAVLVVLEVRLRGRGVLLPPRHAGDLRAGPAANAPSASR